ncbi:hypothetical protein [Streptomyces sp. NPDC008139]|uniref:hypothetical protein n=1 Tax=Streptomyces sp. NPDC008139 TaxID=3364814 RepID=UPI0036E59572
MSEPVADLLSLPARYKAMMTADLERAAKERERISREVAALQARLRRLASDETWLTVALQSLPPLPSAAEHTTAPAPAVDDERGRDGACVERLPRRQPATRGPALRDLVIGELLRQGGLLSSHDVAVVLRRAHPHRRIKEPALRRVLEELVEQSKAQRGRRGSRVFYLAADATARETAV